MKWWLIELDVTGVTGIWRSHKGYDDIDSAAAEADRLKAASPNNVVLFVCEPTPPDLEAFKRAVDVASS